MVYSSTSAAYGLANEPPLREDMPRDCLNPYSVTKCAGEELCKMYNDLFGLPVVYFRYFNVYGERQPTKGQYAPVIGLFRRQMRDGEPMTIVGDGTQRRDFTYVKDVVEANLLAASTDDEAVFGELFNVGTGKNYSILDLVKMMGGEYIHIPPRPAESKVSRADNSKIERLLGWSPKTDLETWVRGYIND